MCRDFGGDFWQNDTLEFSATGPTRRDRGRDHGGVAVALP